MVGLGYFICSSPWFSYLTVHVTHLGILLKGSLLVCQVWGGACGAEMLPFGDAPRAHPGCSSRKRAQRSKAQDSGAFLCDFPPGPLICIVPATCLIFGVRPPKRRYCLPSASGAPEKVFVGSEVLSLRPGLFCMPYTPLSDE